jgi:hypothetical protein
MRSRDKLTTAGFFSIALLLAVVGVFTYTAESAVRSGELMDEERLTASAVRVAQEYGLKSEPTILFGEYIWGQEVESSNIDHKPKTTLYVVSLRGDFEAGRVRTFLPLGVENTIKPEGVTLGINARTGDVVYTSIEQLVSMKPHLNRAIYEMNAQETQLLPKFEPTRPPNYPPEPAT